MNITLREYKKEDFSALQDIIRKTWHYDDFSNPETAQKLARVFLSSCLTNYTYSCVALDNEKPVGIILVNNKAKHKCSFAFKFQQIRAILSLYLSKEGRKVSKIFSNVNGIDKELVKECGTEYPVELALFAIDSSYRGKGIGKQLFHSALEYIKEQQLKTFYLFTDTSCNYGFYEHQGMVRKGEKKYTVHMNGQSAEIHFFIYDYTV